MTGLFCQSGSFFTEMVMQPVADATLSPTVLVIDDDHGIVSIVNALLASERIGVLKAYSGEEGLDYLRAGHQPSLILLDLSMPGMDGREFYRRAREWGFDGPIIFCSAYGAAHARREMGAQGAIEKPFDPEMLIDVVRECMATRTSLTPTESLN